jgi:UDP-glucose 4-epimerase
MPKNPINPYGRTKHFSEEMIKDFANSWPDFRYMLLRYFNPVGAHSSGEIGESPQEIPSNLMPYIADVASGKREKLYVFGGDWPTEDGTGVRDYIHIQDLANAHVAALKNLTSGGQSQTLNIGTGNGFSVLKLLHAYEKVSGKAIPYEIVTRRPGDVAISYADVSMAKKVLGWEAHRDIYKMCEDSWRWSNLNL